MMLSLIAGIFSAIIIIIAARFTRFEKDRSFYPTILMVIASYYILFAIIFNGPIIEEILVAIIFFIAAIVGFYGHFFVIGLALIGHAIFDLLHPVIIDSGGVPSWWPLFCAGIDMVLGIRVIQLSYCKKYSR